MIRIAHRGNTNGRNPDKENLPEYILSSLEKGFYAEIDVWVYDGNNFFLGHDEPTYPIDPSFLENKKLLCHAKNIEALKKMISNNNIHCFWHKDDEFTLTSRNWIFSLWNEEINGIKVFHEDSLIGICSDSFS